MGDTEVEQQSTIRLQASGAERENQAEEKGARTLHLATSMTTWPLEYSGRPTEAPNLRVPAVVELTGGTA